MGAKDKSEPKGKTLPKDKKVPGNWSRFLFCWMFPLFYNGYKRDLEEEDLVPPKKIYFSKTVGDNLESKWLEEEALASAAGRKPSFKRALFRAFFWSFLPAGLMQLCYVIIRTGTPLLFSELLNYWSVESRMSQQTAVNYGIALILCSWVGAIFNHHGNYLGHQFGMKLRVATGSLMFRKIMRMDNGSLGDTTAGKIVNILSNDLQRFDLAFLFLHYIWIIPIQLVFVIYFGYVQAGYAALIGLLSLSIIALPIQGGLGQVIGKVRLSNAEKTDNRIKVMSEVISGMQVIKMYGWELPFEKMVNQKRDEELVDIRAATWLRAIFIGFTVFTERTALFISILAYTLLGNKLSATVIYPLQQFMNAAQINITMILPFVLSLTAELLVSLQRVEQFLSMSDRPDLVKSSNHAPFIRKIFENPSLTGYGSPTPVRPLSYKLKSTITSSLNIPGEQRKYSRTLSIPKEVAVVIHNVSASWTGDPDMMALKNISARIKKGKLCAIIGSVGSGKSSFLQLLLKELPAASGNVSVFGKISYACQEAWLFPSTVRENILFGLPYEPEKYKKVCKACALEKDFKQFPFGDQTLVGERGVSMSGGQRARINLARAVYREADIYLLDDPLSAVDANVGRQLFEGCISKFMKGSTRILVTHQIHFLKAADFIIVLNHGAIENMGTFDELITTGKEFPKLLTSLQDEKYSDNESICSARSTEGKKKAVSRTTSMVSESEDLRQFEAQKIAAEERQSGNLQFSVVWNYFKSGGLWMLIISIVTILATAVAASAADYWISYWSNEVAEFENNIESNLTESGLDVQMGPYTSGQYLIIQGCLVAACLILTFVRVFPCTSVSVAASRRLHNKMFSTMLRGIMRFFDTSSSGRILNRFTKDIGAVDEVLPKTILDVVQIYCTLLGILVLNAIALYWTLIPSFFLLVVFYFLVKIYMKTAQSVKRLEGTTKSPIFGMVTSSLNGIATIRAAGADQRLVDEFDDHQDLHTAAFNGYLGGGSAFGLYLDSLCLVYMATIIAIFLFLDFDGVIPVGSVGLAVTQSNMLTAMLQHGARMFVEFFAQLTSVERVLEYTKIETEANLFKGKMDAPPTWPSQGLIEFHYVSLRYALDEEPVLKNINISIGSGLKVGIVGRTGAGKSSLISAMFRFAYIDGEMLIDGIDTSLVSRQELRSKISIIPQEPVLFSATIRYNLDPFDIYSDDQIWRALEQVDMKSAVPSLDFKVTEGGSNFSVGQRQLMCLARAVLRSNKILIMDEATANVDPQTDNFIQETIRRQFASCTVLTIAHRLNTIMDSDRVLVMDTGRVVEFDHPYVLLSDHSSHFYSMVQETGEKTAAQLFQVAKDAYFQSNLREITKQKDA